ncbi:LOW QUALITY PROTEIN: hypothetical protein V1478_004431 [Vespula squamosa]|uniref:Uncharacterized protein n=1 Tax=Vespula squamosa TaxID=30214 RepID=A0ABD2BG71_VESSQ
MEVTKLYYKLEIIIYKHLRIVKGHHTIRRRSCSVLLFFLQQIKRTIKIFQEMVRPSVIRLDTIRN